jgi:hypothetical protein
MIWRRIVLAVLLAVPGFTASLPADEPSTMGDAEFAKLHGMLVPQPGESRWLEIDWYPSIWAARQKAAAEGKPIFIMAGSGGAPAAGC